MNNNYIRLFTKDETNFNHNKRILSDAISAFVTETTDGIFDYDLVYPLNDSKQLSGDLVRENIIKSPFSQTDVRGEQLFTIRKRSMNTKENRVTIYAQAKARRDFDKNMVLGLEVPAGQTRKQACQQLLTKCVLQQGYTIGNLDTNPNTSINLGLDEKTGNVIDYLDISGTSTLKGFLSDSENSIFKAYGGEIVFNNLEVNMVDERGTDNSIFIESGKNLEELQQDIDDTDTDNFATAVLPCSSDDVYLPNSEIIYSPNATTLGTFFLKKVYDDVTLANNTPEAFNVVYDQLRERVQKDFNNGLDKVKETNTIKYVQVMNTEEYKPYRKLFTEKCEIGNNVTVRYYMKNDKSKYIDAVGRVVKIKFNVLKNRIEEIEIGDRKKKSVLDTITSVVNGNSNVNQKTNINKANIKVAKAEAIEESQTYTDGVKATLTTTDNSIIAEVSDYKTKTDTKLSVMDGKIEGRVEKNGFGSYLQQFSDSIVAAIKDATGTHKSIFDSTGQTIENGGFRIKKDTVTVVFNITSSGTVFVEDLELGDTARLKGSWLYNGLANMEEITTRNLKAQETFSCKIDSDDDFYINGFGGNLAEYIHHVMGS